VISYDKCNRVTKSAAVPAVLRQAMEIARSGRPELVNVSLDNNEFHEGSISM
jgi:hypothetical protein